ncbi:NFACT family protein [Brevibacillus porteri]|uniref:Rqc2 homolog RqcH n=1 Tax=Brevibacillus porteri TaxID=2126350 RepID=A0ABX5FNQ1_9BACL|nr:NFACT RNA binding domain-containing protein [Brevibacillus porteri]MED1802605.1 NFACT RNA binding domain-containing protein [Brevibacillus porteri]MED2133704.1 NFACT RNA binding domain-containing protein [Brevibacillus porteri]MED2747575.1 NFACT RNA binding domain-containing protein [Brevibacillus porteri]MED2813482.1 NFACT RNA binding domain-containing protein [Brevibacillus porteri]MED2892766.1 NFACT RNA binding domain-containing protein [Brevibacillus porteri]
MAFDGVVTRSVTRELHKLVGGRISKIHQPHHSDIVMQVRTQGETVKFLLSANPTYPRLHITTEEFTNPLEAPMFCMLLRKHCEGGVIESVQQIGMERIIHIDVRTRDELGDTAVRRIIVEIMGKHSNIILIDPATGMILDSAMHVTLAISQYRQVTPGRPYVSPPSQDKRDPLTVTEQAFISSLDWNGGRLDKQIVEGYTGISPLLAKEILHRAGLANRETLWAAFSQVMKAINAHEYVPSIVEANGKAYFHVVELTHLSNGVTTPYPSIQECLQAFYEGKALRDTVKQRAHDLIRFVTSERNKNEKKIEKLEQTLQDAHEADQFRLYGELITANMHQMKRGDRELVTVNWYDEAGGTITIPLDPLKTPSENLQSYYKRYNKAKNSLSIVSEQIEQAHAELLYLDGVLVQLEHATLKDAEEIREELVEQSYMRDRKKRGPRKKKETRPELDTYLSSDGIEILVGKNNKQNEYLTNKLASSQETWLHTKDIPGSHVVIRAREFSDETLLEAANLAAYFSRAKEGSQIPVDYTLIKHVKKPSGAKPGYVIYEQQRTLYVTPDEALIRRLKSNTSSTNSATT